jgi:hypothetical protein
VCLPPVLIGVNELPPGYPWSGCSPAEPASGHEGVILRNVKEGIGERYRGDTYIVFDPKQVKHAERNIEKFDPNDPNILAHLTKLESTEFYLSCRPTSGNLHGQA